MKIYGMKIEGPNEIIIPIPRPKKDIVFIARGVIDLKPFDELCPFPKPKMMLKKGGIKVPDLESPAYKEQVNKWGKKRTAWMVLQSLRDSPGVEWETVKMNDPDTWLNYETELHESGFSDAEITSIINGAIEANGLDEKKVEEARRRFTLSREEAENELSSRTVEQNSTPSGELASV